jgi:NAD(P)-dependent dehydrogenase (short-subunit alcohol dehydrogenase family)
VESLEGRTGVVTGSAGGIGFAIAEALGACGMNVAVADIDEDGAAQAAAALRDQGIDARSFRVDVSDEASVDRLRDDVLRAFGDVGVLCNNAGVSILHTRFLELTAADWDFVFHVNVFGMANGLRSFLPVMADSGREHHIVNTASMSGLRPSRASVVYTASKYAAVGLTESLVNEMADSRIGFSVLLPGAITTDLANNSQRARNVATRSDAAFRDLDLIDADRDPAMVGPLVVKAIRRGDRYIITHPELWPGVAKRHEALAAAFDEAGGDALRHHRTGVKEREQS